LLRESVEQVLDFGVTFGDLLKMELVRSEVLPQREQGAQRDSCRSAPRPPLGGVAAGVAMERWQSIHNPILWLGLLMVAVSTITLVSGRSSGQEMRAFVGSNFFVGLLTTGGVAIFPVMLHSTLHLRTR